MTATRLPQKFLAIIVVATTTLVYGAHRSHGQGARADAEMLANRAPAKESIRRALLVGVNIYQPNTAATPARGKSRGYWYNLDGPTNDVDELRDITSAPLSRRQNGEISDDFRYPGGREEFHCRRRSS